MKYVEFVGKKQIIVNEEVLSQCEIGTEQIAGRTLYTMISAGTEINGEYLDVFDWGYPRKGGYTAVFLVECVGSGVQGFRVGDVAFTMGCHQSYQSVHYTDAVKVPKNVKPEHALFIRMANVPMATLSKTGITPGELVLVTGLGAVGLMALAVYSNLGYKVIGVDPDQERRAVAAAAGFQELYESVPLNDGRYNKKVGLALECSGNEAATLDCCKIVRPHGEVSVVGVPWKRCSDVYAFDLLNAVFYNYVKLYSGWEFDLQQHPSQFVYETFEKNFALAMDMLASGKIKIGDFYTVRPYTEVQSAFDDIYNKKEKKLSTILSWDGAGEV